MTRDEAQPFCLTETIEKLYAAADAGSLRAAMAESFARLGYDHFIMGVDARRREELGNAPTLTSLSDDAMKRYRIGNLAECDPMLAHAWNSDEPLHWSGGKDRGTYKNDCERRYAEFLRNLPLLSGIAIPLSRVAGKVSAIFVGSRGDVVHAPNAVRRVTVIAKVAMMKAALLGIANDGSQAALLDAELSSRQLEILQWAARGKSNADIAVITGQSKRAVDYHVSEILRKLKVSSRAQAVALTAASRLTKVA
ncbi:helix-turn-helix transcriptional regulator [Bosea thiooxidans]